MTAYIVVLDYEILDEEGVADCARGLAELVEANGGKYLMRGGPAEAFGPAAAPANVTISEFESADAIRELFAREDMNELRMRRRDFVNSATFIIEGV